VDGGSADREATEGEDVEGEDVEEEVVNKEAADRGSAGIEAMAKTDRKYKISHGRNVRNIYV
jgi:hypothetical protein